MRKIIYGLGLAISVLGLSAVGSSLFVIGEDLRFGVLFWRGLAAIVVGAAISRLAWTRRCPNCLHRFKANKPLCPHCRNVNFFA